MQQTLAKNKTKQELRTDKLKGQTKINNIRERSNWVELTYQRSGQGYGLGKNYPLIWNHVLKEIELNKTQKLAALTTHFLTPNNLFVVAGMHTCGMMVDIDDIESGQRVRSRTEVYVRMYAYCQEATKGRHRRLSIIYSLPVKNLLRNKRAVSSAPLMIRSNPTCPKCSRSVTSQLMAVLWSIYCYTNVTIR